MSDESTMNDESASAEVVETPATQPNAIEDLQRELKETVSRPKPTPKAKAARKSAPTPKAKTPATPRDRSKLPHANPMTPTYAKAHRAGIMHLAKAAGVTFDVFVAMSTSRRHGIFDVREQRVTTAKVFAQVPEKEWNDTKAAFCFLVGRRERLADALRAEGRSRK
mgnify:CR=1 FL=1